VTPISAEDVRAVVLCQLATALVARGLKRQNVPDDNDV
jgi:hypothetical protein